MTERPLALDDDQLELLRAGAVPIPSEQRDAYLQALAAALPRDVPLTNAALQQAVSSAQRQVLNLAIGARPKGP